MYDRKKHWIDLKVTMVFFYILEEKELYVHYWVN